MFLIIDYLKIKVVRIKGDCPVYSLNDSFKIIEGYKLISKDKICMHSLASIMPYYTALSKGVSPKKLGLSNSEDYAYVQCLDPCEKTGGGTVIFKIILENK